MAEKHIHYHNGAQPPKPTFERKAQSLKKIMLIFIIIIFSGMLLAYSVSDIPEAYVSEMVGINDDKLNTPISELNGLTLNQVFEDENYFENSQYLVQPNSIGWLNLSDIPKTYNAYVSIELLNNVNLYYIVDLETKTPYYQKQFFSSGLNEKSRVSYQINYSFTTYSYHRIRLRGGVENSANYNVYYIDLDELGIDNLTKEQMDYYYNQYKAYKDTNIQVKVYKDNWTLEQKENIGTGGLTAVTGFVRQVEKVGVTIGTAKDIFVYIIENDIIRTISNTLQDISNGIRDFFEWVSNNLGFENKLPPITLPIPPINP